MANPDPSDTTVRQRPLEVNPFKEHVIENDGARPRPHDIESPGDIPPDGNEPLCFEDEWTTLSNN